MSLDQEAGLEALPGHCVVFLDNTLTLSLSTQEYTWVPVNCEGILTIYKAGNLRWSKGG